MGKSFVAALCDPAQALKDHVFHVYPRGERIGRAVRTERYRFVEWKRAGAPSDTAELELYDYQDDPLETRNLAADHADIAGRMRAILATQPEAKPQIAKSNPAVAKRKTDRAAAFARKDTNHDGKLTREEFLANQPDPDKAPERFIRFDTNKDGVLSREEFVEMGAVSKR